MTVASTARTAPACRLPAIALVGRPNVGKSTLFNRLIGQRKAIVHDLPGVTRDRNYGEAQWKGKRFRLIDTGGLVSDAGGKLEQTIQQQTRRAVEEADALLLMLDGKEGLNPNDREAADFLRRSGKPVFFAVNKIDSPRREDNLYEFYRLGESRLFAISAEHGLGVAELMEAVTASLPAAEESAAPDEAAEPVRIAVVGRPNVGKSTLINRLVGFERSVVDAAPGTTRDAIDSPFSLNGEPGVLVDTAGIRRKSRVSDRLEYFTIRRSLRSVDRGDLVIHVIDGPEGVTDQDAQILSYAHDRGKAILLAVNKWDRMEAQGADPEAYRRQVYERLPFLEFAPVVLIAAATGFGIRKMLATARAVLADYRRQVPTSVFNQALQSSVKAHAAPFSRGRPVKFYYGTQTGKAPPTFTLFVNAPGSVTEDYRRYLINQFRRALGFSLVPVRLILRARREASRGTGRTRPPSRGRSG
ncbi:MAG TPA: ribosome biogenesis GTPase Der [Candidatus Eisenbacteria bacterium]|nr:ribosome biogenesis GTPase Der [Candidatus Eisenbacteria bacterium]